MFLRMKGWIYMYCIQCGKETNNGKNVCDVCIHNNQLNSTQPSQNILSKTKFNIVELIFIVSSVIAVISLFLPWVSFGFLSVNGFQQDGYLFLFGYIYAFITAIMRKNRIKGLNFALVIISFILVISFYNSKSTTIFDVSTNGAAIGFYLFIISSIGTVVGAAMDFNSKYRR